MVGASPDCPTDVAASAMIRAIVAFLSLVILADVATAGPVPYTFRGINVTREGGRTHLRGTSPSESANYSVSGGVVSTTGSANWYQSTGALVQSGGVVFNAVSPLAADAAAVALTAVRGNPAGLVTTVVGGYLLSKGIEYVNGQFQTTVPGQTVELVTQWNRGAHISTVSALDACQKYVTATWPYGPANDPIVQCGPAYVSGALCRVPQKYSSQSTCPYVDSSTITTTQICPAGTTPSNGQCVSSPTVRPTNDSDWTSASTGALPDAPAKDLISNGVPLPVGPVDFTPDYQDVPVGDPVVDPLDGNRYRDVARVTPSPNDPRTADVQVVRQQIDENGNPVVDPQTSSPVPPQESKDPCASTPDRVGCKDLGEVEDVELETEERGVSSITVQSFGSNASCPAPIPLPKGASLSFEYPCAMATGLKPFLLALAWLVAGFIIIGAVRET